MKSLSERIRESLTIDSYLQKIGVRVPEARNGNIMVSCPLHEDKTPSCSVAIDKGLWKCFSCQQGGTIIDMQMRVAGQSCKDAMFALAEMAGIEIDERPVKAATYAYKDRYGKDVMRVDRIEEGRKKKFRQYTVDESGREKNGIDGVMRSLYRIERWHGKEQVALCEGEKCVHALESIGIDATTNPGGSGGWLDAYAEQLTGKYVEIWPDADEPAKKWVDAVTNSLKGKCAALRICETPKPYNDVADLIEAKGADLANEIITDIQLKTDWIERGVIVDLLSSGEAFNLYRKRLCVDQEQGIDLGKWLPTLKSMARPLQAGDMMLVLADTGVGKTGILSNIAYSQHPSPVIFFELELSAEAMAERFVARDTGRDCLEVERSVRGGQTFDTSGWGHVYICPNSKLTVDDMEKIIIESELKIGRKPELVLVDYVGLLQGGSGKRYERMSTIAEDLKRLARITNTVVCVASQVARKEDRIDVSLHDAKDSGSLENSAQLVIGAWRPDIHTMMIKVLKQTRRAGQFEIVCNYDGNKQRITERTAQ